MTRSPRPVQEDFDWPEGQTAWDWAELLNAIIGRERTNQDPGQEYDTDAPKREVLEPTPKAVECLRAFMGECHERADAASNPHAASFWECAAEQAARFAAKLALWRQMSTGDGKVTEHVYNADEVTEAIEAVQWHAEALADYVEKESINEMVRVAKWVVGRLPQWAMKPDLFDETVGMKLNDAVTKLASGDGHLIKNDIIKRRQVFALLEEHRYIATTAGKGRWWINRHVLGGGLQS